MAQWIYGKNAAMQILKSKKKIEKALVAEGTKFPEAEALLKSRRIPVQRVSRRELDKCCMDTHHQGIALYCEDYKTVSGRNAGSVRKRCRAGLRPARCWI